MKYTLILPFVFLYQFALAQVPNGTGSGDISGDIILPVSTKSGPATKASYYSKNSHYGFINLQGVEQAAIYDKIESANNGFIVKKDKMYGIADPKGVLISKMEYDSAGTFNEKALIVKKNGSYGTISGEGKTILSLKYNRIIAGNNDISLVQSDKGITQLIFNEQEKVLPSAIEQAVIYGNVAIIKSNGKFGAVKKQLVLPLTYDSIFVSENALYNTARSRQTAKRPLVVVNSRNYQTAPLLTLQNGNKYGLADENGTLIYPVDNDAVLNQESLKYLTVKKGNLFGIYFIMGKKKTDIEFGDVYADGIGFVMAVKNHKSGVFDLKGTQLVPFEYDPEFIAQYRSIGFRVAKNKKRGIVGKKGEILVAAKYDDVDPIDGTGLDDLVKVKSAEKFGIVNLAGKTIIPTEFQYIEDEGGMFKVVTVDKKVGLYDKTGKVIIPARYSWIMDSDTENSNLSVLVEKNNSYNFLNKKTMQLLFKENITGYGHILDEAGLINSSAHSSRKSLTYVKGKNGKCGLLNEITGLLDVPMVYDEIIQRADIGKDACFSVRNGNKYGLINSTNKLLVPVVYDGISLDLVSSDHPSVVVRKGRKFGTIDLEKKTPVPFLYDDLQRISYGGLYKAKIDGTYQVVNSENVIVNKGPFDEVSNFERNSDFQFQALTFYNGKMRVINILGKFSSAEVAMQPHQGYKTFDELKGALVKAMDSKDELQLKEFATKIAPSKHLLFYLTTNPNSNKKLQNLDIEAIKEKYYRDLRNFKRERWGENAERPYNRYSLTVVKDYTQYRGGLVTNSRSLMDSDYGDNRLMSKLLKHAIKVNGYWISTYFMLSNFDLYGD